MARDYRTYENWLTGLPDPLYQSDKRKGDRHKRRYKAGFVAWDGESVTDEHGHDYVMLVSSNDDLILSEEPGGLSTVDCLDALLKGGRAARNKHHVGFAFSYDVNMVLRDLDNQTLERLWENGRCWWQDYRIQYVPRKEFSIKRGKDFFRLWDVWGFFQGTFVSALHAYGHTEFLDFIARMKERRSEFTRQDIQEMLVYCRKECEKLSEMMGQFSEYLQECDLRLSRYDGAGAVASALLKKHGVKSYMQSTPENVQTAAAHSYFGGRIELVRYGHVPDTTVYQYDVRSAYPSVIQNLPCLACGDWHYDTNPEISTDNPFTCYLVQWDFDSRSKVCPFPWRDRYGSVFFPRRGSGWYWQPEVEAALSALQNNVVFGSIEIKARYVYRNACDHLPFSWVSTLYDTRAEWKANGIGAEKVLKLGLNSLYGKSAQRIGWDKDKPPAWHQLEWSGYVTSKTRARLYEASFPVIKSNDLIAYATDAIFSTAELPTLDCSNKLGAWEFDKHNGGTFVQSGVYWVDNARVGHTRGFAKDSISPDIIVRAWKRKQTTLDWSITRFVGLGRALTGPKQLGAWRTWKRENRTLSLTPVGTKRTLIGNAKPMPHLRLVDTDPTDPHLSTTPGMSTPIKLPWLDIANAFDADASRADLIVDDESDSCYD